MSNSNLITLAIRYIPVNPALILSKIKNLFQNFSQAKIAILSIDASSMRLQSDAPFITVERPNMPLAMVLRIAGHSAWNIM